MVAPLAVEAQVARREPLVAKAVLLQDAARSGVLRHHRRLDAVQAARPEGELQRQGDGLARVPAPADLLVDEVAQRRALPRAAHDIGQRDAPAHRPAAPTKAPRPAPPPAPRPTWASGMRPRIAPPGRSTIAKA